jgi:flagellar assembly protein FliH
MDNQRVIKAYSLRELGQKVVFDFEDFHKRCDDHLEDTRQQAQEFLSQAREQVTSLEEQAQREGYEAGHAAGMRKADLEIQARADAQAKTAIAKGLQSGLAAVEGLAKSIADAKVEWLSRWETTAIKLCVSIAEKIIRAELSNQPNLSQSMIRELLEIASSEQRLIARVHPDDALSLNESAGSLDQFPRLRQMVECQPDPTLSRGDCVVLFEQGMMDGRVKTQLQRLTEELIPLEETPSGDA